MSEKSTIVAGEIVYGRKEAIRSFCEQVNDLACINDIDHKRAMVILCKQLGITLTFEG